MESCLRLGSSPKAVISAVGNCVSSSVFEPAVEAPVHAIVFLCLPVESKSTPYLSRRIVKAILCRICNRIYTERVGFEPTVTLATPVFKTGSLNHSDTSPINEQRA